MRPGMVMLRGGRSGATVSISNQTISDFQFSPDSATASITLESDGDLVTVPAPGSGSWLLGSTTGSNYEVRATLVSGTSPGTTGTWLALSSNRTWSIARSSFGVTTSVFDLEIGLAGANNALDTARITLRAEVAL